MLPRQRCQAVGPANRQEFATFPPFYVRTDRAADVLTYLCIAWLVGNLWR